MLQVEGDVPKGFEDLTNLRVLKLQNNHLKGVFEPDLGLLENLKIFDITDNQLHGTLKMSINVANAARAHLTTPLLSKPTTRRGRQLVLTPGNQCCSRVCMFDMFDT